MRRVLTSKPIWFLVIAVAAYTAYWFYMADKIEQEIYAWVEDQAKDGTEVAFENLHVSGYPLRLVAAMDNPDIFVRDGDRRPHWHGAKLKAITPAFTLARIRIEFIGTQTVIIEEDVGPMARPPAIQQLTFDGSAIEMRLDLTRGRIANAEAEFNNLTIAIEEIGDYRPVHLKPLPQSITLAHAIIKSRVRAPHFDETGAIAHDYSVSITDITNDRGAPDGFAKKITWIGFDLTETGDEDIAFHNGSLKLDRHRPRSGDKAMVVRKAGIIWDPITLLASGHLKTPGGGKPDGAIDLEIAGYRQLLRVLADSGDISPLAAILTGALVGIVEVMSLVDDEGTLHVPLEVRRGNVSFSFLPLTSMEELREAARIN